MSKDLNKRIVLAGFLIITGTALLLRNLNLLPGIPGYIFSWPMLMILIGSYILVAKQKIIFSLIIIGIGLYFLLPDIMSIYIYDLHIMWPLIFIFIGILMVLKTKTDHPGRKEKPEKIEQGIHYINFDSVLCTSRKIILSQEFKGGKITNFLGGSELNFLNAKLAPGKNYLDLSTIFGSCTLIIPPDWNVNVDLISIFGGFADKRQVSVNINNESSLIIKGACLFGGGEIISHK